MSISEVEAQLREVLTRCQAQLFLWCADWTAVALQTASESKGAAPRCTLGNAVIFRRFC